MRKAKEMILISCILFCMLCSGCHNDEKALEKASKTTQEETTKEAAASKEEASTIQVFVCGQVKNPGVYELDSEDRIVDAIEAAGGLTKKASYESVNQAQKMEDGQQIYIPSKQEQQNTLSQMDTENSSNLISINQASADELMTLPGIGESKANSIIAYREEHGGFQKIDELMEISGIKEGVYNKIKDYITL